VQTSFIPAVASSRAQAGVGSGLRFGRHRGCGKSGMQAEGGRQRKQRMRILRANMKKTRISPRFFSRSRASKGSQSMDFAARNVDVTATAADFLFVSEGEQLSRLAVQYTVPVLCVLAQSVRTGGSMSYAPSTTSIVYQAWLYAGRILKGEKPADLPVLLPTKFELVINLKTAKALGIQVPEALLATADEVLN
jgi:ABC-type uncharacterized transport system substrate-binding protein